MKKWWIYLLLSFGIAFGVVLIAWPKNNDGSMPKYCPFCDSKVINAQKFYEDDLVIALYTHRPIFPGHCLVIPKRHVERFEMLTDQETSRICQVIKRVNSAVEKTFGTSAYLILEKNGREAGQTVFHVHFHYVPRKAGDDSILKFLFKMFWIEIRPPISSKEMTEAILKIQEDFE